MSSKTKPNKFRSEDSIEIKRGEPADQMETVKDMPKQFMKTLWEDFLQSSVKQDAPTQLFGIEGGKKSSISSLEESVEYKLGSEGEFKLNKKEKKTEMIQTAEHREYFRQIESQETLSMRGEQQLVEKRVKDIMTELKMLAKSSKTMEVIFKQVTTEQMPVNPGTYHINFFEWLLIVIRNARRKIDEGSGWLAMFASKKKQKQYWAMSKKHGTTFSLSSERTVATQTA